MPPNSSILPAFGSCQHQVLPKDQAMNTQNLLEKIYDRMATKNTDELIAIWKENDHGLWSDSAFEVIQKLLVERGVALPIQGEMKVTVLPPPKFEIPWEIPYLSRLRFCLPWILFGLFLVWIFLIHPFYFFTYFSGPLTFSTDPLSLWPHSFLRLEAQMAVKNSQEYGKIQLCLRYIELGIMSYGVLVGYFVLRKSQKSVAMIKVYLIQFLLLSISLLLFFNVYPLLDIYWEINSSVLNLEPDWDLWLGTLYPHSIEENPRWSFFLETLKVYWLPIASTIIWYTFLIRSKWLATTFPKNPTSSNLTEKFPPY